MPLSKAIQRPASPPRPDPALLFDPQRVWVMGVLNSTPDSFFAPSRISPNLLALAQPMIEHGADILDLGGESTRPGAAPISEADERDRVLPALEHLRDAFPSTLISIDTRKAAVAAKALAAGADVINDISALRHDPAMAEVIAQAACPVVLMHMQGTPATMQQAPHYEDVITEIQHFFEERLSASQKAGIAESRIILDPGIGFGKTLEHNLTILRRLRELAIFGRPLLVGASRKTFIGKLADAAPEERLAGSIAAHVWAASQGARGLRVHDVREMTQALAVWKALAC